MSLDPNIPEQDLLIQYREKGKVARMGRPHFCRLKAPRPVTPKPRTWCWVKPFSVDGSTGE